MGTPSSLSKLRQECVSSTKNGEVGGGVVIRELGNMVAQSSLRIDTTP